MPSATQKNWKNCFASREAYIVLRSAYYVVIPASLSVIPAQAGIQPPNPLIRQFSNSLCFPLFFLENPCF
jgi:hypothetical protein